MQIDVRIDEWKGCYPSAWKHLIVPGAIVHPAKFSSRLIVRIYQHMVDEGWLKPGDTVIDPFGGVALGARHAMYLGLHWIGVELEAKFVELGNANIDLWNGQYAKAFPEWGSARLLQGDSRQLLRILSGVADGAVSSPPYTSDALGHAGGPSKRDIEKRLYSRMRGNSYSEEPSFEPRGAVSSPPYAESLSNDLVTDGRKEHARALGISNSEHVSPIDMEKIGKRPKGYRAAVSSPPYADGARHTGGDTPTSDAHIQGGKIHLPGISGTVSSPPYSEARVGQESGQEHAGRGDQYGPTPGQLGAMKAQEFDAALSSPPYHGMQVAKNAGSVDLRKNWEAYHKSGGGMSYEAYAEYQRKMSVEYGDAVGQLANMRAGDYEAAVTSPPYNKPMSQDHNGSRGGARGTTPSEPGAFVRYGNSDGQIEDLADTDFWLAARQIVDQVYLALAPGAHAVWVVKDFVKDKQRVPFCNQWRTLCEAAGFATVHEHHALLVNHRGTSHTLDGGTVEHKTESKSFFRRLAESKGSPRIDHETVFCMERP